MGTAELDTVPAELPMIAEARFRCESIRDYSGGMKDAVFTAVSPSDGAEFKSFWQATPSGKIELSYIRPDALFKPGVIYKATFEPIGK